MNVQNMLQQSIRKLEKASIGTARLDVLILLEDATGKDRAWLLAHPEFELNDKQVKVIKNVLKRRAAHEPLAYIRGHTEFYGREFLLNQDVLEPRPESETMIDLLKKIMQPDRKQYIADVGTGSGALGITAQLELPDGLVELLDIDQKALKVAKMNVDKFTLNISVKQSDLLAKASPKQDILLCNLPYVPDGFQINPAAMREPRIAIFGGPDGLDVYRKLFNQVEELADEPLYILTEALPVQHELLRDIAESHDYTLLTSEDFIQVFQLKTS
ncbi:MAG TPA: HemK/PrmC family methyltransferase [Verrucomicrobiae bacterium]|nr:HemK/PrmC family methyltransferase [Verrucomicrobiae bacterium]